MVQIEKMFRRKKNVYNKLAYAGNEILNMEETENCYGRFFITNGFDKNLKEIYMTSLNDSGKGELYYLDYTRKVISFGENAEYFLKTTFHSRKMKIIDSSGETVCLIVFNSEDNSIYLERNLTNYELHYDDETGETSIYEKDYYDSVIEGDDLDEERLIASIYWDLIDMKKDNSVSELTIYNEDYDFSDFELFTLFAISSFMLYHSYMQEIRAIRAYAAYRGIRALKY